MALRTLSRLAWYFGIRRVDPSLGEQQAARPLWLVLIGGLVLGLPLGVISEALAETDFSTLAVIVKAVVFAVVYTAFHAVADRRSSKAAATSLDP